MSKSETLPVASILQNEVWFGDELVTWENAPTGEDAKRRAAQRARRLRTKVRGGFRPDHLQLQIADQISACCENHRCGMGCCPKCLQATQHFTTDAAVKLTANEPEGKVGALSFIPPLPLVNILGGDDLRETMRYVRDKIEGTGLVEWAVLCLDVSWNDFRSIASDWPDSESRFGWQPHVYGFIKATSIKDFKAAIEPLFPPSVNTPVPINMKPFDGSAYGASYAFKGEFQRRVSYRDKTTNNLNARDYCLTSALEIELMRALAELGLAGRIELIGLKTIQNSKTNKISLAVINKQLA